MSLNSGLTRYYKFDGNAIASVGSNGTENSSTYTTGKLGQGLVMATNQYVNFSSVTWDNQASTVSFWFRVSAFGGIVLGLSSSPSTYARVTSSTTITISSGAARIFTVPTMSLNTWYHVAIVRNANEGRLYLNGIESSTGLQSMNDASSIDQVGRYWNGASGFWPAGVIDEVGFWNRAVSTSDIAQLYNNGNGRTYPFSQGNFLPFFYR